MDHVAFWVALYRWLRRRWTRPGRHERGDDGRHRKD